MKVRRKLTVFFVQFFEKASKPKARKSYIEYFTEIKLAGVKISGVNGPILYDLILTCFMY